jgi:hypothetical protein
MVLVGRWDEWVGYETGWVGLAGSGIDETVGMSWTVEMDVEWEVGWIGGGTDGIGGKRGC